METLTRRRENLIRALGTRHGRKDSPYCLAEGLRTASEAVRLQPDSIELCLVREGTAFPDAPEDRTCIVAPEKFDSLCTTVHSQGILLLCREPETASLTGPVNDDWVLLLDRIQDPGNFGTILRTARAAGLRELWTVKGGVDPFCDKSMRSGMGAQFAMRIRCADSLAEAVYALKKLGITTFYRTEPAGGHSLFREKDLFRRSAVILGNEANGAGEVPGAVPLLIPMPGSAESLNVAQAATVVLFEYVRRTEETA